VVFDADYEEVDFAWFSGGRLNASLQLRRPPPADARRQDRHHLGAGRAGRVPHISYRELKHQVCRVANVLLHHGVRRATACAST
jgi:acetyl-CoA synthetase